MLTVVNNNTTEHKGKVVLFVAKYFDINNVMNKCFICMSNHIEQFV